MLLRKIPPNFCIVHSAFMSVWWQLHWNSVMAQEGLAENYNYFQFTVQMQRIWVKMPILKYGSACGRLLVFLWSHHWGSLVETKEIWKAFRKCLCVDLDESQSHKYTWSLCSSYLCVSLSLFGQLSKAVSSLETQVIQCWCEQSNSPGRDGQALSSADTCSQGMKKSKADSGQVQRKACEQI